MFGSGTPLRQFIYSEDLARLMIWALQEYSQADPIIFSSPEEISIASVAEMIAAALDFKGNVLFDTTQADGQHKKTVSTQKLQAYLPNFQFTPMQKALCETVKWFVENWNTARR